MLSSKQNARATNKRQSQSSESDQNGFVKLKLDLLSQLRHRVLEDFYSMRQWKPCRMVQPKLLRTAFTTWKMPLLGIRGFGTKMARSSAGSQMRSSRTLKPGSLQTLWIASTGRTGRHWDH